MKIIVTIYTIVFLAWALFTVGVAQAQTSRSSTSITPLVQGNIVRQNVESLRRQGEQARKKDSADKKGKKHDSGASGKEKTSGKKAGQEVKKP